MQQKEAIAVFSPSDPLEKAIQDAYHTYNDGWLPAYPCQLAADCVTNLKIFNEEWIENEATLNHRIDYFFSPSMTQHKDEVVFVTKMLYLRDILEHEKIDSYLHGPVCMVTRPIAHYLLREYPIHIHIDYHKLKAENPKVDFIEIGGMVICQDDVSVSDCIVNVENKKTAEKKNSIDKNAFSSVKTQITANKVAVTNTGFGVFRIDKDERTIKPGSRIYDKFTREEGHVSKIELGENGTIEISYDNGNTSSIPKIDFDRRFVSV